MIEFQINTEMAIDTNRKTILFCLFFVLNSLPTRQDVPRDDNQIVDDQPNPMPANQTDQSNCWMSFDVSKHFKTIDGIDRKYAKARRAFHDKVAKQLNSNMLKMMSKTKEMPYRAVHNAGGENDSNIPSGQKLGGKCMVRRPDSILFFYRMKTRNNTVFRLNFLENDVMNMTVRADVSLNDLHLLGAYERSATHTDPSVLFYAPTTGEVEVRMNDIRYKMQGHLRLQEKRFVVETVLSELVIKNDSILMTFVSPNVSTETISIEKSSLEDFLDRLKTDLDLWIKSYLNDYFTYFQLNEVDEQFKNYEKARTKAYNEYSNYIIKQIKKRINKYGFYEVDIPKFTLFAVQNMQIRLTKGVVRGFDTIHKRSVATGRRWKNIRNVYMTVGFSNLKVEYQIDVKLPNNTSTAGHLQLSADDLTAQLQVTMVRDPETVNLGFKYIGQLKPESLVVAGAANQLISHYKHLFETNIIAIMTNALIHDLKMLGTVTRCKPLLFPSNQRNEYTLTNYEKRIRKSVNYF